jgi:hypothetical protein
MVLIGGVTPWATATPTGAAATPVITDPGTWSVQDCPGINPIHVATLKSGKFLLMAGSGYNGETFRRNTENPLLKLYKAWIYDPESGACPREIPLPQDVDLFCAGMTHLPDGRILVYGGTGKYGEAGSYLGSPNYYKGIKDVFTFDEATELFTQQPSMSVARWYGNGPVNAAGNPIISSGLDENAAFTPVIEQYNAAANTWSTLPPVNAPKALPMYAGMALLPTGQFVFLGTYFGSNNGHNPETWNWQTGQLGAAIPGLWAPTVRNQGRVITLYPKAYVIGGGGSGSNATGAADVLDLTNPVKFTSTGSVGYAAMQMCGAVLPDTSIFVAGGSLASTTPLLDARRLLPGATAWSAAAKPTVPRMYHSTCMATKSGKVVTMGTNYSNGTVETRIETYKPWYMQPGITRGSISSAPANVLPGQKITVTSTYASMSKALLTRLPSDTHQMDPNGLRSIPLTVAATSTWGVNTVTMPATNNIAPVGDYWLTMIDWRGVPTPSLLVHVGAGGVQVKASGSIQLGGGAPAAAMPCCCC